MERKSLARFVPRVEGEVFDFAGDEADETEVLVGRIGAYLVRTGRAFDEGESLFDAMDSIDQSVHDGYCALFDPKNDEWSGVTQELTRMRSNDRSSCAVLSIFTCGVAGSAR